MSLVAPYRMRGVAQGLAASVVVLTLLGCHGNDDPVQRSETTAGTDLSPTRDTPTRSSPTQSTTKPPSTTPSAHGRPVTIAFAGDIHFESFLAARLDHPRTAIGPMARTLAAADLSIVNLETAVTTRGAPQPKEFTFRAPPAAFTALKDAGIDVATMANNHALDYGPVGVPDALSAAAARSMPVIGIGENAAQAYAPWIVTLHGQRVAFLAATAFLVPQSLVPSWSAGPDHPGLAMAMPGHDAALVAAVEKVRPLVDTVVVDMHWGSDDLRSCPTPWQRRLAGDLTRAGADIVVGQHTHVLQGAGYRGSAYVDYGMGNFEFYVANAGVTAQTGVLVLTVDGRQVSDPRWVPGEVVDGLPTPLKGAPGTAARQRWAALRDCTGLTPGPSGRG
jgi:poly-gamma-glutamate capsule biosynthesis protein CapA/YwtB (metallophosphatase superfamily)